METIIQPTDHVLLVGDSNLTTSVAVCLLKAGHKVDVHTDDHQSFSRLFRLHVTSEEENTRKCVNVKNLQFYPELPLNSNYSLVIALTSENLRIKQEWIKRLESLVLKSTIIAINIESIALDELLTVSSNTSNLLGLNWTDPAHTTFFLEIIEGESSSLAKDFCFFTKLFWGKDPYIVKNTGIRSRLISAMAREASYLIDNGYATVEDIDRACRNDAGYYLPFSGNCRYMDLMGTYAYGMVMKDLNPELANGQELPDFFKNILDAGGQGMKNKQGFYSYSEEAVENWEITMEEFSYQIQALIEKYPFNYKKTIL